MFAIFATPEFWVGLGVIIWVNIILSGDNAVVIALAARSLPKHQQKQAVFWGAGAAVILRIALTVVAVKLLEFPYLKLIGGAALLWIAVKLLVPEDDEGDDVEAHSHLWGAIRTILIADLVMSTDNVIAVAAAAKGSILLLVLGLVISIPLVVFGATMLMVLMERYPIIIVLGAAVLGWTAGVLAGRWWQLLFGIICMTMIANLQYGWTLFVNPIDAKFHWGRAAIQVAFTIFVLTETWLVPIEGYLVDRFGPRPVVLVGGVLCGIAWAMNSFADSLSMLYVAAAIGGTGAGAVYGTCVGNAVKLFADRRGLAAGLTAAGFGAGSALTIIPISSMIKTAGYQQAFLYFGLGQGIVVFIIGMLLVDTRGITATSKMSE